ncbi:MAG: hypothetical protein J6Q00_05115, partial [Verrucomicrobia bacterium]|nr:hypothetical protein [Verrucomicrobiota bacterium]
IFIPFNMTAPSKIGKILFGNLFWEKFAAHLRYKKLQFFPKKEYIGRQRRVADTILLFRTGCC